LSASLSLAQTLLIMDAFFSKVLAASDGARRESSGALSTLSTSSTTPSEKSDSSDDQQRSPIVSSVYVASHQGDAEKLSHNTLSQDKESRNIRFPRRDSKTLSRKTLVDIAEGCNDVHYFSESHEAQLARKVRPAKTWSFDVTLW
jgi:hypothetical protein